MISKKFLTSSLIYTFSFSLATIASFLLIPFYTNTKLLGISDVGALAIYISFSLLILTLASLTIDNYINVAYQQLKDQPEKLKDKIASLNGYIIASGLILLILFGLGGKFIIHLYIPNANPDSYRFMMMSVFTGVFSAHFRFYIALLINQEKPWTYFGINVLNFATTVLFSVGLLELYPQTLEGPMWGRLLSAASIFLWSFIDVTRKFGIAFRTEFLRPTFNYCIPIMITTFFQWIQVNSDRYIIQPLLHNKEVAIFDLAAKFSFLLLFLMDGLYNAVMPRIFSLMKDENNPKKVAEINKYYSSYNLVVLLLIISNLLFLPILLPIFISDQKYYAAFLYFGIICSGLAVRGPWNIFVYPILFERKTGRYLIVNGMAALVQIILGYVMIKYFGLYGAAFTLVIVKIILVSLYAWFSRDLWSESYNVLKMIVLPAVVILIICISEMQISAYGTWMHLVHLFDFILILGLIAYFYYNEILDALKWSWKKIKAS